MDEPSPDHTMNNTKSKALKEHVYKISFDSLKMIYATFEAGCVLSFHRFFLEGVPTMYHPITEKNVL